MMGQGLEDRDTHDAPLYGRVIDYVRGTPWAITPDKLAVIVELLVWRASGGRLSKDEIRARIGAADQQIRPARSMTRGGVAVLGLRGIIAHRAEAIDDVSGPGGTSIERFRGRFREALADDSVGSILIDVDSPGGAVDGVAEIAEEIRAAPGDKPIVAIANTLAASAAYWIAAQADEISVSPSAEVGSIGVFGVHEDFSKQLEIIGVDVTLISAGKFKTEGNPFEPLSEEARQAFQARVDDYYSMFVTDVAKGRGVKVSDVRAGFGEGRVVGAKEAVALGMADRIETLDQALARLGAGGRSRPKQAGAVRRRAKVLSLQHP